jgi:hypothetical protein
MNAVSNEESYLSNEPPNLSLPFHGCPIDAGRREKNSENNSRMAEFFVTDFFDKIVMARSIANDYQ